MTGADLRHVKLEVPIDKFWQLDQHHAAMLREFALIAIGVDDPAVGDPPTRLLALVTEMRQRYGETRMLSHQQLRDAAAEGRETAVIELTAPAAAADEIERVLAAYEEADEFCTRGDLLTLATSAELAAFRRELSDSLVSQLRG